jgi:hypothetical protein
MSCIPQPFARSIKSSVVLHDFWPLLLQVGVGHPIANELMKTTPPFLSANLWPLPHKDAVCAIPISEIAPDVVYPPCRRFADRRRKMYWTQDVRMAAARFFEESGHC